MKRVIGTALMASVIALTTTSIQAKQGVILYNMDANMTQKAEKLIAKGIDSIGFTVTDPNKNINDAYKKKYGSTVFEALDFFPVVNEGKVKSLLEKEPRLAGFNPFNLLLYRKKGDSQVHVGHLMPDTVLDILKISDKEVRTAYKGIIKDLDTFLGKTLGDNIRYVTYTALPEDTMMNFEITLDRSKALDDVIDDFQDKFESAFEDKQYIIAGFENYKEAYEDTDDKFATYDAFWTYSLCHFTYSYSIFDHEKGRPDAGVFAPCTMYMYIKKGSNVLVIGMPKLANWKAVNGITDPKKVEWMQKLDTEIPSILREALGAKEFQSDFGSKGK